VVGEAVVVVLVEVVLGLTVVGMVLRGCVATLVVVAGGCEITGTDRWKWLSDAS
jgi:hypothetical protein